MNILCIDAMDPLHFNALILLAGLQE